jgi:hypothetical protein
MTNETVTVEVTMPSRRILKMAYNRSVAKETKLFPAIRFSGDWLAQLGFSHDGYFSVTVNKDKSLTLRPCDAKADVTS